MSMAFGAPRRYLPPDLCYAVAVKEQEPGRGVNGTTRCQPSLCTAPRMQKCPSRR